MNSKQLLRAVRSKHNKNQTYKECYIITDVAKQLKKEYDFNDLNWPTNLGDIIKLREGVNRIFQDRNLMNAARIASNYRGESDQLRSLLLLVDGSNKEKEDSDLSDSPRLLFYPGHKTPYVSMTLTKSDPFRLFVSKELTCLEAKLISELLAWRPYIPYLEKFCSVFSDSAPVYLSKTITPDIIEDAIQRATARHLGIDYLPRQDILEPEYRNKTLYNKHPSELKVK